MLNMLRNRIRKEAVPERGVEMAIQEKKLVALDAKSKGTRAQRFEARLHSLIVGQDRAVRSIASLYQIFQAGLNSPNRPLATMLLLGPTGSGKTRVVEAAAEILFGKTDAVIKIDCAEFQQSHEVAKLIGAPPGYLGHRETSPLLGQENLNRYWTKSDPFTILLFDEIEKASEALWQLLLGVLDKAKLTLDDNRPVDFSQTMIFMTSNLGANEISELVSGGIGFAPARGSNFLSDELGQKIYHTAIEAARRRFSPEFMNRIDKVVVFRSLNHDDLREVLDLELGEVQRRIDEGMGERFTFTLTDRAKEFLLAEGIDYRYGARHLKRSVERFLVNGLANLSSTGQARTGDVLLVDFDEQTQGLAFFRDEAVASIAAAAIAMAAGKKPYHNYSQVMRAAG
jgi:ATP-dependent Clp protease ATP-binding subunit ClpA